MATRTWDGSVDGDWTITGNWVENVVPVSGDEVYIVSGSVDIDASDQSAVDLDLLVVGSQYTGSIGTAASPLQIGATVFDFAGMGSVNHFAGVLDTVTVQNTGTSATALWLSESTIDTLRILGGNGTITIDDESTLTSKVEQIGATACTTDIASDTTFGGSCELVIDDGVLELNKACPTITTFGGSLKATVDGTVTTLNMYDGLVRWTPTEDCTITTLTVYGGKFDSSESTAPSFTVIDTTLFDGIIDERSGLLNATWTNSVVMEGGLVYYDINRKVAIY